MIDGMVRHECEHCGGSGQDRPTGLLCGFCHGTGHYYMVDPAWQGERKFASFRDLNYEPTHRAPPKDDQ